ncbi:hypothetical protein [Gluconobacter sphaericus]|uniref:Uncharacterized protein n=1 Tax=Gluconobacter sphaericus NBRC 12467 TaxID=1307951 RepID=A0AA37SFX2_9PROT|nr:hypothetical protein [Gluconobacter sphaericus]MBF0885534.1 hypothetical protein [Gluconobacter sphaericus]GBR56491.1 hypothetical protein AA12467_2638 [Gluconobacter sphaericus NBRC 12467]GEB42772.1 hypothetical protein GSP01_15540 [Gluconobacter sphaericus NBRC 12467]GLQ84748.1 hypothetical protein GCM10007872_16560 [Gluconobacter sphaericus NBRC 12467]GLQ85097.1 hypothetical protein GCM10007872_20050 [Gluconobacter sphaericus NBRC 12467]
MADTVTVLCRMPHGLRLRIAPEGDAARRAKLSEEKRPDLSPVSYIEEIEIKGANRAPDFHSKDNALLGRVGRTTVDKAFWDAWVKQNADSDLVKNHCVFAELTEARANAKAAEFKTEKTGFEPLDPVEIKRKGLADAEEAARARAYA